MLNFSILYGLLSVYFLLFVEYTVLSSCLKSIYVFKAEPRGGGSLEGGWNADLPNFSGIPINFASCPNFDLNMSGFVAKLFAMVNESPNEIVDVSINCIYCL